MAFGGIAIAKGSHTPTPTQIARGAGLRDATSFVDSHGTLSVAWESAAPGKPNELRYARRTKSGSKFSTVALPATPQGTDAAFIYETSGGALRIIADVPGKLYAWQSTTDGASWTTMDTTALNTLSASGTYIYAAGLVDAPGGPIQAAGSNGSNGPVVQLNSDLTGVTTVGNVTQGENVAKVGMTTSHALFILGYSVNTPELPYEAGGKAGTITFPACPGVTELPQPVMAVGRSAAVVADSVCGHVYTRTIGSDGSLGPVVTVGETATRAIANLGSTDSNVDLGVKSDGSFVAVYADAFGDFRVATSSNGARWKTGAGAVPVNAVTASYGFNGSISKGNPTWYAGTIGTAPNAAFVLRAIPLDDRYSAPHPASSKGIPSPKHATYGSLVMTYSGHLPTKSIRKTGIVTVGLAVAIPDTITLSVTIARKSKTQTLDVCSTSAKVKLVPGKPRTVKLACAGGGIVIGGGPVARGIDARKGDTVTFSALSRNGSSEDIADGTVG